MAAAQEPEVQLAQRLASNEKPVRTRAMKKLRKYISARSQKAAGGFTGDELLKLWKGLFYCLWMQDKPLLQEELSNQISTLIHSFSDMDKQLMYLQSFLQTFKREWTGIDRLRMDKFYQLVRFMFRQTFDVLRRRGWESSVVGRFLELLKSHLLLNDGEAPSGLLLHILDLYLTELAAVGAAELTADQNLTFIEPFCRKAAKTKNHTLFSAICKSFFSTIIDQAPFAVEDLMREVKAAGALDSEQESEEDDEDQEEGSGRKALRLNRAGRRINGRGLKTEEESDDELLDLEDSDSELPDENIGPVLQFDYAALADKLFELASRSSTPGYNRQKLYRIIKVLRDLSEGIFPQDEYPEEVSTDEDDEMFGSRRRMKRAAHNEEEEEGKPAGKKSRADTGGKSEALDGQQNKVEPVDEAAENGKKKKKKRKNRAEKHGVDTKPPECSADSAEQSQSCRSRPPSEPQSLSSREENQLQGHTGAAGAGLTPDTPSEAAAERPAEVSAPAPGRKRKKKKKSGNAGAAGELNGGSRTEATAAGCDEDDYVTPTIKTKQENIPTNTGEQEADPDQSPADQTASWSPGKRKKKQKGRSAGPQLHAGNQHQQSSRTPVRAAEEPLGGAEGGPSAEKAAKRKKRKISVEFEFEADEMEAKDAMKKSRQSNDVSEPSTPQSLKKSKKKNISGLSGSDFITFQRKAAVPTPLYCKTNGSPRTPTNSEQSLLTPRSESKKVTFGLKNNKTAEFKRSDRSLLLSPEGLSRVPFDPQQKPKFGVLKSPPNAASAGLKKTPKSAQKNAKESAKKTPKSAKKTPKSAKQSPHNSKKGGARSLPNTPKRRPSAADFF